MKRGLESAFDAQSVHGESACAVLGVIRAGIKVIIKQWECVCE